MSTSTSTPLSLFNSSAMPSILSQETSDTSFYSVPISNIPELPSKNKNCSSKIYHSFVLMGILICISLLLYMVIYVNFHMKISGDLQSNLGNFNISLQSEGSFNLTSKFNSSVKTAPPTQLWEQLYVDNMLS